MWYGLRLPQLPKPNLEPADPKEIENVTCKWKNWSLSFLSPRCNPFPVALRSSNAFVALLVELLTLYCPSTKLKSLEGYFPTLALFCRIAAVGFCIQSYHLI